MDTTDNTASQHLKAVLAVSCACLLLVAIKAGALLQYWQQTHHILLQFGGLPNTSSYLPNSPVIKEWKRQWENTSTYWAEAIAQSESRMLLAGQLLLLGDKALPEREVPVMVAAACPEPIPQQPTAQACPEPKAIIQAQPIVETPAVSTPIQTAPVTEHTASSELPAQDISITEINAIPTPEAITAAQAPIPLHAGDRLLLVGDSLMQGLAPHLVTSLKRAYKVDSMDLSKHSTGLTYPAFFDWPATVEDAFELEQYTAVIVFLGANDPWDMTIHGRYIRFATDPWKAVYRERVARIIQTAAEHHARLLWLGAPPMGREDLLNKVPTLNAIYAEEVSKHPLFARFVTTDRTITSDGSFTKFLELPERGSVMVRTDDGVHFTTQGHRLLAQLTLSQFEASTTAIAEPKHESTPIAEPNPITQPAPATALTPDAAPASEPIAVAQPMATAAPKPTIAPAANATTSTLTQR
jgi:uncharacterized protein